jgi:hypothetical protein
MVEPMGIEPTSEVWAARQTQMQGHFYEEPVCQFKLSHQGVHLLLQKQAVPCAKTVPESDVFMLLGLALSEKKVPQITENTEKPEE